MPSEQELIPYHPTDLLGEKLLVLAPHPDDEVIGPGGLVALHAEKRRQVRVIVVTDGVAAATGGDPAEYRDTRERETRSGLELLGVSDVEFLRFPDRSLSENVEELSRQLYERILAFEPDLIVASSLIEIHPDHVALARALVAAFQQDLQSRARLALTRIAFCEVSRPLQPNALVDISSVAAKKFDAIKRHQTQQTNRNYEGYMRGLNAYRAMTLDGCEYAEAFFVLPAQDLTQSHWASLTEKMSPRMPITSEPAAVPLTAIVRTRDRLALLKEAVDSIRASSSDTPIIVVNDGGPSPREVLAGVKGVRLVEQKGSAGRSEAMNIGVQAAETNWICFLDDDDLYFRDHIPVLSRAAAGGTHRAYYSDAISTFLRAGESGEYEVRDRLRLFSQDYDPKLLLLDNYIPLPTLIVQREDFLDAGGFDRRFDLFEDWDFLIRLSRRGPFLRVPAVTCEIRHFEGGTSAVLNSPEGSVVFRRAKLAIWEKHRQLVDDNTIADAFETQKRKQQQAAAEVTEALGRAAHLQLDVARLSREKEELIEQIRLLQTKADEAAGRAGWNEHVAREAESRAGAAERKLEELEDIRRRLEREVTTADLERRWFSGEIERYRTAAEEQSQKAAALYGEIARLNGILETIYRSRTWKLHEAVERIKRRRE